MNIRKYILGDFIGKGLFSQVFEVYDPERPNLPLVIKKPLPNIDKEKWLLEEEKAITISTKIAKTLALKVVVPIGQIERDGDDVFIVSSKIAGRSFCEEDFLQFTAEQQGTIVEGMAMFLHRMHHLQIPPEATKTDLTETAKDFVKFKEIVYPYISSFAKEIIECVFGSFEQSPISVSTPVLCHYDISFGNVLYDTTTNILGILDFGSVNPASAYSDFRKMASMDHWGDDFTQRVVNYYNDLRTKNDEMDKIDFAFIKQYAVLSSLKNLARKLSSSAYTEADKKKRIERFEQFLSRKTF